MSAADAPTRSSMLDVLEGFIQELRSATDLRICESCGRFLYWQEPAS